MYDVIIVGGGPAGQSAALFTSKAGKQTLVLDNGKGMTQRAYLKNHYGAEELEGNALLDVGRKQAEGFGTEFKEATVSKIEKTGESFTVETDAGESFEGRQVILATGANQALAEAIGVKTVPATEPRIKTVIDVDSEGRTNIEGIWACGTAGGVSVHTIITSGDGARVAVNLLSELNGERYVDHDMIKK
ncbi:FAD-dependent oxidoreductase [Pullulanibacillus sp. KACC 23026]|uniref:FAD-dependent oxidoreductase n=1 Tax=Pullulanibacillus sp. KACC 23026 TaxID=3028315 RepID=UPI0023B1C7D3|nr:FAD-dependent oxidoreductase [Pullulanibacillus sp. KACC 23026]WEG14628.1 FAD-dependent oxidoreductase [Pullulanibacillus sp. KACC 23026]